MVAVAPPLVLPAIVPIASPVLAAPVAGARRAVRRLGPARPRFPVPLVLELPPHRAHVGAAWPRRRLHPGQTIRLAGCGVGVACEPNGRRGPAFVIILLTNRDCRALSCGNRDARRLIR